jgi:cytochrome c
LRADRARLSALARPERLHLSIPGNDELAPGDDDMKLTIALALAIAALGTPAIAGGDVELGEKVFKKCKACHTIEADGKNKVGPNLHGIVGAEAGRNSDFKYSDALKEKVAEGLVWTEENLRMWLEDPQKFAKKSKMVLKLNKDEDRDNVIAYLKTLSDPQ